VAAMVIVYRMAGDYPWPDSLVWNGLSAKLDSFQSWLLDQRSATPESPFFKVFDGFATFVDDLVDWFTRALLWLSWLGAAAVGTITVLRFGGVRAAVITASAFASFALLGLWEASMETLALMLAAVGLSLLVGIPLGIVAGRSDRFQAAISPVLDAMQIIPAFAYLMPVVILFSVGPAAAVVSTMVYAVPPAVRITALGIRGVATNTVEAAASMGSTRRQMLGKVQLPLARRMLLLGVNQTILFGLSMVVIAGLIGGGGLGAVVTSGLYTNPALAVLGGVAIVIMAMALDRGTEAIAGRTDPTKRHLDDAKRSRLRVFTLGCVAAGAAIVLGAKLLGVSSV
jgi:glycine betaine/proline transport system permease protein